MGLKLPVLDDWFRCLEWNLEPLDKSDEEYSAANPHAFGDALKYRLVGIEPFANRYDPMTETPKAYLEFIHLAEFRHFKWDANRIIEMVLKFSKDYGPLWVDVNIPLTVERILVRAIEMNAAAKVYKLLKTCDEDYWENSSDVMLMKDYLAILQNRGSVDLRTLQLVTYPDGLRLPMVHLGTVGRDGEIHPDPFPSTTQGLMKAAIASVSETVNHNVVFGSVAVALANREARDSKLKEESRVGSWIPAYRFGNLISALWLQFYLDILNQTRLRECDNKNCLRLFNPTRSDQIYCSRRCRINQNMRKRYTRKNKGD